MQNTIEKTNERTKTKLLNVAKQALLNYDISYDNVEYFTEETNTFFKVYDANGMTYGLKICQEESTSIADNHLEAYFLSLVKRSSDIVAPEVICSKSGQNVTIVDAVHTGKEERVILYKWLDGEDLEGLETDERFFQLGQITAKLHKATLGEAIPEGLSAKKWDQVFYFTGEKAVYFEEQYSEKISEAAVVLLDKIIPFLNSELQKYYQNQSSQLIHGDLNPWNVLVKNEELWLIDFEDAIYGNPLFDIAITLYYYRYNDNYPQVKNQLIDGYKSVMDLPDISDYDLDVLMAARRVNFINYVLLMEEDPVDFVEKSIEKLKLFCDDYQISL